MGLTDDDVSEILRIIDESKLDELRVRANGFELHVRRAGGELSAQLEPAPAPESKPRRSGKVDPIPAPMLGVFYVADGPGEEPFVSVGSRVEPATVVGIIEVMKMMNTVEAGIAGTIVAVCVENAELVEDGQALFQVEPGA